METNFLFTYGTLLKDSENEHALNLKQNCSFLGNGYFSGKLFDAGAYPGAIHDPKTTNKVFGNVFLLRRPTEILTALDEYEGYGESFPQPNEFVRKVMPVVCGSGTIHCWTYLYNLPADNLFQIKSGDYSLHLNSIK